MAVENIGSVQNILKNTQTDKWSSSVEVGQLRPLDEALKSSSSNKSFSELLSDSIAQVNDLQLKANKEVQKLASGESKNIHETLIAVEKADIAFRSMNQVRQKVLDAYKEIMNMQV